MPENRTASNENSARVQLSGTKPLPKPLSNVDPDLCCHMALLDLSDLRYLNIKKYVNIFWMERSKFGENCHQILCNSVLLLTSHMSMGLCKKDVTPLLTVVRLMKPTAVGFIRYGRRRSDRIRSTRFVW